MADIKVTKMVMKVDLQCSKCYKKIKRVLCRYPQVRDQVYDDKNNRVFITVVCCSPERVKEKIICGAGDTVESIETIVPTPAPAPKPPTPAPAPKPPTPAPVPAPPPPWIVPIMYPGVCCCCCYEGGPCYHGRGYSESRCCEYLREEDPSGCSIM